MRDRVLEGDAVLVLEIHFGCFGFGAGAYVDGGVAVLTAAACLLDELPADVLGGAHDGFSVGHARRADINADVHITNKLVLDDLKVQLVENYGQVQVAHSETGKPLPETYVKVYARLGNGQARFYKDGYTDLRGRFDYASLNPGDLDDARDFSILVLHDRHGAAIREAKPPSQ